MKEKKEETKEKRKAKNGCRFVIAYDVWVIFAVVFLFLFFFGEGGSAQ